MRLSWGWLAELRDFWLWPHLHRGFGLVLSFLGFGLIAGASGLTLIVANDDSDPRSAFAFAPLQTTSTQTAAQNATEQRAIKTALAPVSIEPDTGAGEIAASKAEPAVAAYNPPLATAAPSGSDSHAEHSPAPVIVPSQPPAPAESAPVAGPSGPQPAEAAAAAVEPPAPAAAPAKPRKTAHQQSGSRHAYRQTSNWFESRPRRSRYAQHFWPFW